MKPEPEGFFSPDYATARNRFRSAARAAGGALDALPLECRGPGGEELAIDIARVGAREPRRVLLHTCGLHGVEAFAGAAVQLAALARPPEIPEGCALVLVSVLNPYGMAWLRRVNENNVDLNRNFLPPGSPWRGAHALYSRLDSLLNPSGAPRRDAFWPRLALAAARHGPRALRQAIAEGQYEFPGGLFYGGSALEPGPRLYLDWLRTNLARLEYAFALDLHTGLGRRGDETLFLEPGVSATPAARLAQALGRSLVDPDDRRAGYRVRGSMGSALPRTMPGARIDFVLQEIGTRAPLAVLKALREENRWHHHGRAASAHPSKQALRETFGPASPKWRRRSLDRGLALLHAAAAWAFKGNDERGMTSAE